MPISPLRPWQSRVGAWASEQSQPIASREALEAQVTAGSRGAWACRIHRRTPHRHPRRPFRARHTGAAFGSGRIAVELWVKARAAFTTACDGRVP